jgi:hypothetical protein
MEEGSDGALRLEGDVDAVEHLGEASLVYLRLADGTALIVRAPDDTEAEPGGRYVTSAPDRVLHIFRADGTAVARNRESRKRRPAIA